MAASSSPVENALLDGKDDALASLSAVDKMSQLSASLQKIRDRPYENPKYVAKPLYKIGKPFCSPTVTVGVY